MAHVAGGGRALRHASTSTLVQRARPPRSPRGWAAGSATVRTPRSICDTRTMTMLRRIAPIFAVRDLDAAITYYRRLGFVTRVYEGGGYAFASRDGIEIHLGLAPARDGSPGSAYLWVDDADELAATWRSAGAEVHLPQDTAWGQHEGAVVDADGNVIRFGSQIAPPGDVHTP